MGAASAISAAAVSCGAAGQPDGVKTIDLDGLRVTWIRDNAEPRLMERSLFPDASDSLMASLGLNDGVPASVSVFLVEKEGRYLLFDTGLGMPGSGLLPSLHSLGLAPEDIDCIFLTHFHGDHIGTADNALNGDKGYKLTGITMVGDRVKIHKLVDRAWPDYNIPTEELCKREFYLYGEYRKFTDWQTANNGMEMEQFEVGAEDQFKMVHNPGAWPDFSVRNLCGNGYVWTGTGTSSEKMYTDASKLDENMYSCGVVIQYGKFRYWNCGDIPGCNWPDYASQERTFETPVSEVCGPVTVMKLDHHGTFDTKSEECLENLQPKAMIALSSHIRQPYKDQVVRMMDKSIYPGERELYVTTDCSKNELGDLFSYFKPAGHIVVRVYEGGTKWQMFVLDAATTTYDVIYKSDIRTL